MDRTGKSNTSKLYYLEPVEIGTSDVESITSFIKRLAFSHSVSVGMLLDREILPELDKPYLHMNYIDKGDLNLNGYSGISKELVDILEIKTSNRDLKYLTLIPWEYYINTFKLYKSLHSWCPICYEEMKQNGQTIYDKLIWNIEGIEVCERHKIKLEQTCPYCGKKMKLISSRSRAGYCDRCHAWLGLSRDSTSTNCDWQYQIYDNVGKFLSESIKNTDAKSQFNNNIQKVSSLFDSQRRFYKAFNLNRQGYWKWLNGNKPALLNALIFSLQLGIPLNEILTTEIDLAEVRINNQTKNVECLSQIKLFNTNPNIDYVKIKKLLNMLIHSYDGTSLSRFCEINNIALSTLKKHFPKETELLLQLFQIHKENISHKKRHSLKESMDLLHEQNIYPSIRAICDATNRSSLSINDRRMRIDILEELGYTVINE